MGSLAGKIAVVTGATRGIGYAIAERFLADGAEVLVTGRSVGDKGPNGSKYFAVDFEEQESLDRFLNALVPLAPDILINNAGINKIGPFAEIEQADFERIQRVNLLAPFAISKAVLAGMRQKKWGRIISISSIWGKLSRSGRASYSASKFALDGMTVAMAAEVSADGVMVNCIAPGFIDTELTRRVVGPAEMDALLAQVPARRLGQPAEIAAFVSWLAGPENTYITGQNIAVDGGFTRV